MTIESMDGGAIVPEILNREGEPTSVEEVTERFSEPVEISDPDQIVPFFESNIDKDRVCISIPITNENKEERRATLALIGHNLLQAIFAYTKLNRETELGSTIRGLIGEATSDVAKHTVLREKFDHILALVTKDTNIDISFHLVNPARPDVNLNQIQQEDSIDEYDINVHGQSLARGFEEELKEMGCKTVTDESHLVKVANNEVVAVQRDLTINGLPEQLRL